MGFFVPHAVDGGEPLNMGRFLNSRGSACDEGQVLVANTALKAVENTIFERPYPPLKSAQLIFRKMDAGAWATSTAYHQMDGSAKMVAIGGLAGDLPEASAGMDEKVQPVREFGTAYGFGRKELIHAAKMGIPLDSLKARMCMRAYEELLDKLAAHGDLSLGIKGLLTLGLPRDSIATGIDSGSTNASILAMLNDVASRVPDRTNEAARPNVLVLPIKQRDYLANTPYNTGGDARSILQVFLQNNEYITEVVAWTQLKAAGKTGVGTGGNDHVMAVMRYDEMCLRQQIPEPFTPLEPQMHGTRTVVNCVASIGGVECPYPEENQIIDFPNNDE